MLSIGWQTFVLIAQLKNLRAGHSLHDSTFSGMCAYAVSTQAGGREPSARDMHITSFSAQEGHAMEQSSD